MCSNKAALRQAAPHLAAASLTACLHRAESLSPDETAQAVFLSAQNKLRLNVELPGVVRQLVHVGTARAAAMSAMSFSQFLFGAAAVAGLKHTQLQVCLLLVLRLCLADLNKGTTAVRLAAYHGACWVKLLSRDQSTLNLCSLNLLLQTCAAADHCKSCFGYGL